MTSLVCGAKINLSLHIGKKLPDGLHELQSIFLPLPHPADRLFIELADESGARLKSNQPELENPSNLLLRAYRLFGQKSGCWPGIRLFLQKGIPQGAGLGGGSSDAGAFLNWLNSMAPVPLTKENLLKIALLAGSDVPFFLSPEPALVEGRGERISPIRFHGSPCYIVLVWPGIHVSTKAIFDALDAGRQNGSAEKGLTKPHEQTTRITFTRAASTKVESVEMRNDLEAPAFQAYPELPALREKFLSLGAFYSGMSGSGSTMFGLFRYLSQAQKAIREMLPRNRHVYFAAWSHAGV